MTFVPLTLVIKASESKNTNFAASVGYHYSVDTSGGNVTATLPALSGLTNGDQIRFKLYNATNDLILTPASGTSDQIDGLGAGTSYTMSNPKSSLTLVKGANDWEIV